MLNRMTQAVMFLPPMISTLLKVRFCFVVQGLMFITEQLLVGPTMPYRV